MKKLFTIATLLLIIGIGLPILAANSGDRYVKNKYKAEKNSVIPGEPYQSDCKKKREAKEAARALEEEKAEAAEVEEIPFPKKGNEGGKENSANTSFNFLYYLFYKSSINEFIKDIDYCESTAD